MFFKSIETFDSEDGKIEVAVKYFTLFFTSSMPRKTMYMNETVKCLIQSACQTSCDIYSYQKHVHIIDLTLHGQLSVAH